MENICIDVRALQSGHARRGIGVYVDYFLKTIRNHYYYENRPKILLHEDIPLLKNISLQDEFKVIYTKSFPLNLALSPFYLSFLLTLSNTTIFHALSPLTTEQWISLPFFNFTFSVLATIHDLNLLNLAKQYPAADQIIHSHHFKSQTNILRRAQFITTNSEFVRKDLIEKLNIDIHQTKNIYPGIPYFDIDSKSSSTPFIATDYVLFVGEGQPKNLITCLKAMINVKNLKLVVVARKKSCKNNVISLCETNDLKDRVIFVEDISPNILVNLYRYAVCLVHPSYAEGFGFPVLEAMSQGCPVICSNVMSMPEVAGKGAIFVEPDDEEKITEYINLLKSNGNLRKEYIERGKNQAAKFNWEDMINRYQSLYTELSNFRSS